VRRLLHDQGYTIKGVQKLHREHGVKHLVSAGDDSAPTPPPAEKPAAAPAAARPTGDKTALLGALHDLETAKARLDGLLKG
jgi:hypothetical protein